jgi:D-alanyl-lipoteichoic acid biosynthesis protein DltD
MKGAILRFIIPTFVVIILLFLFPSYYFLKQNKVEEVFQTNYYPYFNSDARAVLPDFLKDKNSLLIIGSSEMSSESIYVPHKWFNRDSTINSIGLGSAGNQSFGIYMQLQCLKSQLTHNKVVLIISPGWFEDRPSKGTNPDIFLKNSGEDILEYLYYNPSSEQNMQHISEYMACNLPNISSPSVFSRYFAWTGQSNNDLSQIGFYPVKQFDILLIKLRNYASAYICLPENRTYYKKKNNTVHSLDIFKHDSLNEYQNTAFQQFTSRSTGNNMGISDVYFSEHITQNKGNVKPVSINKCQEYQDFIKLTNLCKSENINAAFVIQPLNPYYYPNLAELQPVIDSISHTINQAGFPLLNMFVSDTGQYRKGLLEDIMHLGDAGWIEINKFILNLESKTQKENE